MKKGKTNNPAGRPKGTPNKITKELRALFKNFISNELENLPELLDGLEPKDRLDVLIKLLPYALPKVIPVHPSNGEPFKLEW